MGAWAEVAEVLEVEDVEDADATGGFSHRRALVGAVDMIISLSQDQNYSLLSRSKIIQISSS